MLGLMQVLFAVAGVLHAEASVGNSCITNCSCEMRDDVIVSANCSGRGWTSVPQELPVTLEQLDLSKNNISSLSNTSLSGLQHLLVLDLSFNNINVLPGPSSPDTENREPLPKTRDLLYGENVSTDVVWSSQLDSSYDPTKLQNGSFNVHSFKGTKHGTGSPVLSPFSSGHLKSLEQLSLRRNLLKQIENKTFTSLSALKVLDLSYNQIEALNPLSFHGLSQLRILDLKNNSLQMTPDSYPDEVFADLINLKELNLQLNLPFPTLGKSQAEAFRDSPNTWAYPDTALSHLASLQKLHIDGLSQEQIPGIGFRNLTNLTLLDMGTRGGHDSYSYLNGLPELFFSNITTREPLEVLFTNCRLLLVHPKTFSYLPTMHSLSFRGNNDLQFENFLRGSASLNETQIKKLDLTQIHRVSFVTLKPEWFQHLRSTSLETLIIEHDVILDIDPKVPVLWPRTIKTLSLARNKIITAEFLANIFWMENLEIFNVSIQNKYSVRELPTGKNVNKIVGPKQHIHNEIPHNDVLNFQSMTSDNSNFSQLNDTYDKYHNNMEKNSRVTDHAPKEVKVYFDYIPLKDLLILQHAFCPSYSWAFAKNRWSNQTIFRVSRPNRLELMFNVLNSSTNGPNIRIKVPKSPIPFPRKLKEAYGSELKLGYNIPELHFFYSVLEVLDISKNFLWCLDGPFAGLHKLRYLDLSNNYCIALSPYFFDDMPALQTLKLPYNTIGPSLEADENGDTFSKLTSLKTIDISHNDISVLSPKIFSKTPALHSILLGNNALHEFHVHIGHLDNLHLLDLSNNVLSRLSISTMQAIDKIVSLNHSSLTIDLHHNPLQCDCSTLDFLNWYRSMKATFRRQEQYQCLHVNGTKVHMKDVDKFYGTLWKMCHGQGFLLVSVLLMCTILVFWTSFAIYRFYRVQLLFYIYISKARYFQNFTHPDQFGVKDVFIVYDEEDVKWRRFVSRVVRPALEERSVTCHLSELDSQAGRPIRMVVEESVFAGKKTMVLLTEELFMFEERELEINMAKLSEEMRLNRVLLFVAVEQIHSESIPHHIRNYLEENRPIVYRENDPSFWDELVRMIKS